MLHDGRVAAMKVQYPGIAESIDSDIDNLMMYVTVDPPPLFPPSLSSSISIPSF